MKISSNKYGSYNNRTRRSKGPIVLILLAVLLAVFLWFLWQRGGEKPQQRVEKAIPAEKLGK